MPQQGDDDTDCAEKVTASNSITHSACCTLCRQFSFLPRTTKEWNELPPEANADSTLDTFVSVAC